MKNPLFQPNRLRFGHERHVVRRALFKASMVFASALIVLIVGCTEQENHGKVIIRFVTWKPNQPLLWEELYRLFEAEHPHIHIVREVGPHSSTAFHDLLTQKLKSRSQDVDVFFMDVIWPPEFASASWTMPLNELFPCSEQEKFLSGSILANSYKGNIYGVPLFIDTGILYYRKDLLEKYGYLMVKTLRPLSASSSLLVSAAGNAGGAP